MSTSKNDEFSPLFVLEKFEEMNAFHFIGEGEGEAAQSADTALHVFMYSCILALHFMYSLVRKQRSVYLLTVNLLFSNHRQIQTFPSKKKPPLHNNTL